MEVNRKQKTEILFGDQLHNEAPKPDGEPALFQIPSTYSGETIHVTTDLLSKHILLLGGIGTGKTNAFFHLVDNIKRCMTNEDVMVIFDTKGDFYDQFYETGDIVISNDYTSSKNGHTDYWNIFCELDRNEHFMENIIEISRSLFADACKRTNQPFFPNAARDIFSAILYHLASTLPPEEQSNRALSEYIKSTPSSEIRSMLNLYPDFRAMMSYIASDDSPQTQGVLSELQQVSREILIGNFKKNGTVGVRNTLREKGARKVFIEYDLSMGSLLTPIYSLIFDLAIKEALSRKAVAGNVYFITDEFRLLPYLEHVDDAVNFGRSLGVKFMLGVQNVEQIYDNYGEERARSILSGLSSVFAFRVNDKSSREYIQGVFGKNRKLEIYMPTRQAQGMVEEPRDAEVVEDWDISGLDVGQAIVGLPGEEPFVFQFKKF